MYFRELFGSRQGKILLYGSSNMKILFQGDSITDGNRYKSRESAWDINHRMGPQLCLYCFRIAWHDIF